MHKRRHQHITSSSAGNKCTQVIKGLRLPDHELSCLITLLRDPPFSPGSTASIPVHPLLNQPHLLVLSTLSPESLQLGHLSTRSSPHQMRGPESWHRRKGMSWRDGAVAAPASGQPFTSSSLKQSITYSVFTGINLLIIQELTQENLKAFKTIAL